MPTAIVPAAGRSRRLGRPKALLPWLSEGTCVLSAVTAALEEGGVDRIIVVARADDAALARRCRQLQLACAVSPRPQDGMLASVQAGLEAVSEPGDCILVCPVDFPALRATTVQALVGAIHGGAALAVPVHDGLRGHPLAVGRSLVHEVAELDPAEGGLDRLLERQSTTVLEVPVDDPGCVQDLDTEADYRRLRRLASEMPV